MDRAELRVFNCIKKSESIQILSTIKKKLYKEKTTTKSRDQNRRENWNVNDEEFLKATTHLQ